MDQSANESINQPTNVINQ